MLASRQVIEAMQQRLIDASTSAGARVYIGRAWPVEQTPAIKLFDVDQDLAADESEDITWPRQRLHSLSVDVQCLVSDADAADEQADALVVQVMRALEGTEDATTLYPLNGVRLSSQRISPNPQADNAAAAVSKTVAFTATFATSSDDPETLI